MNRIQQLFNRESGISNENSYDFALRRLCVAKEDSWRGILPSNYTADYNPEPPIFSAKFANCDGYRHILSIANEDGKIALQDTTLRNYEPEEKSLNAPQCHYNAVFDLEWAPGQMKFVSASGDHTARLWEVDGSEIRSVRVFNGHTRSVKTAAFRKSDSSVFATGGRDGAIIIWDTRANLNLDLTPRADNCIYSGHVGGPGTPVSQKKRTRTPKLMPSTTSSSITGLVFQDSNTLISCGAGDGIIKVWDLRRNYTAYKKEPHPKYSLPYAGTSTFKGFTNLLIDAAGARLFANCMDNTIYCYNLFSYDPQPVAKYKGLLNSTFYIKSCLSPDGKYLLSGSSDEKAYIWNLDYPDEPLVSLSGHTVEVTCVAWGSTDDKPIVTCSDDARHKIWRIGPETTCNADYCDVYRGHAEYVRVFGKKVGLNVSTHKYNLRDLESTPRSLKRLVEQNERTPGSIDKIATKRSFLEMMGVSTTSECLEDNDIKRPKTLESRVSGRRLFSPSTSSAASSSCNVRTPNVRMLSIAEESSPNAITSPTNRNLIPVELNQENALDSPLSNIFMKSPSGALQSNNFTTSLSPLSERAIENVNHVYTSPPTLTCSVSSSITTGQQVSSSTTYSPTTNLPNYVLDGEAPHLSIMSPKRKLKEKVDWLTKIRKQKLMSSCRGTSLTDKINEDRTVDTLTNQCGEGISSPRLQSIRSSESRNTRAHATPRRRISHSDQHVTLSPSSSHHHPKTPTSSRRNSETTILRFFSVQQQRNNTNPEANIDREVESNTNELPSISTPNVSVSTTIYTE